MMQRLIADKAAALDLAIAVTGREPPNSSDVTRFQGEVKTVSVRGRRRALSRAKRRTQ